MAKRQEGRPTCPPLAEWMVRSIWSGSISSCFMNIPDVLLQARTILHQSGLNIDASFVSCRGGTVQLVIREARAPCQEHLSDDEVDRPSIHRDDDPAVTEAAGSHDDVIALYGKREEDSLRFDMFHGVPADVLHVWLMLFGPGKVVAHIARL